MRTKKRFLHWRIYALTGLFFLIELVIIARLFSLQIIKHDFYAAQALEQRQFYTTLLPKRGEIFTRDKFNERYPLALNKRFNLLFVVPRDVENAQETAKNLSLLAGLPEEKILQALRKKNDPYEPLMHGLDDELARRIQSENIKGVGFAPEIVRYWPEQYLASHLAGFVGFKNGVAGGQYGVEGFYDEILKGAAGTFEGEKDTQGYWIASGEKNVTPAKNGDNLILTVDRNIQYKAEEKLLDAVEKHKAEGGSVIVMEPKTGRILALANVPHFNPNEYKNSDLGTFKNASISNLFEPGSVFKAITMAIAINEGKVSPTTAYEDTGEVRFGGSVIKNSDYKAHGLQTMTQVLEKSLNTGAVFAQTQTGKESFKNYLKEFGFQEKTEIDLQGEIASDVSNLEKKDEARDINFATASFGQGVAITPIALVRAFGALANGGVMMRPYAVEEIIDDQQRSSKKTDPQAALSAAQAGRQVISEQAASQVTAMLINAVRNGYGRHAGVSGYFVAGKTGTAQVPAEDRKGYSDKTIHSFIGFAPAWNPAFVMLVKLDNPQGVRFAETSAAPVFKELASFILNYYEIPPDER